MLNSLGPDKFKAELIDFDKENIPESVIKLIDPIVELDEFHPTAIVKARHHGAIAECGHVGIT